MISEPKLKLIANFLIFQIGWLICILAPQGYTFLFTAIALTLHFTWIGKLEEWALFAKLVLIGFVLDSAIQALQILDFRNAELLQPAWLFCLWLLFASTIRHSLAWLFQHRITATIAGAVLGPVTYIAGSKLGAAEVITDSYFIAALALAIPWAAIMYYLSWEKTSHETHLKNHYGTV